jgi:hypothetical protein
MLRVWRARESEGEFTNALVKRKDLPLLLLPLLLPTPPPLLLLLVLLLQVLMFSQSFLCQSNKFKAQVYNASTQNSILFSRGVYRNFFL